MRTVEREIWPRTFETNRSVPRRRNIERRIQVVNQKEPESPVEDTAWSQSAVTIGSLFGPIRARPTVVVFERFSFYDS